MKILILIIFLVGAGLWYLIKTHKTNYTITGISGYGDEDKSVTVEKSGFLFSNKITFVVEGPDFSRWFYYEGGLRCNRKEEQSLKQEFASRKGEEGSYHDKYLHT